jgi:uncharacterized protein YlxW (UPF0749 family)
MSEYAFYSSLGLILVLLGLIFASFRSELRQMSNRIEVVATEVAKVEKSAREETRGALERIETKIDKHEKKIDAYEERNANTRHEIKSEVQALNLKVAVALAQGVLGKQPR